MDVAVVGSGVSGLVAAYLLAGGHRVTVYEADSRVGGHVHTVGVANRDGAAARVDTGFIVFNEHNYPGFTALLKRLGVASRPTTMSFGVRSEATGLEYGGTDIRALFAQRRRLLDWSYLRFLKEIVHFHEVGVQDLASGRDDRSVGDLVGEHRFSERFVRDYLVPLGSALWSCPAQTLMEFPAHFLLGFLNNHRMLQAGNDRPQWRTVQGGSDQYVQALRRTLASEIRTQHEATKVRRRPDHVVLEFAGQPPVRADHVILACHADDALRLLDHPSDDERRILQAFPYTGNDVTLHQDDGILPRAKRAVSAWNSFLPRDPDAIPICTYSMNLLQGLPESTPWLVSLNAGQRLAESKVVRRFHYRHPAYRARALAAQREHAKLINQNRTSFAGAYFGYGFHEDGVQSAVRVAAALGGDRLG